MPQLLPRKTTAKAIWAWALVAFAVAGWFAAPVQAAFAELVNYQGKLFDSNDNAVPDDDYNIEFKLYTVATGGSPIWTETRTGGDMVTINDGLFSVLLGEVTSLDGVDFNQDLYLSVNIGGTSTPSWDGEMSPRKRLSSVPSAFTAGKAYELDATYATTTNLFATNSTTTNLSAANASTTQLRTATLIVGSDTVTDITGTGLEIASGALRVATGSLGITSSQWTTNASDIYYSTGNVGIGTTTPGLPLSVVGGGLFTGTVTAANFVGTSTATSTLASGLDIATGCFAMNGTCINLDGNSKWLQNGEFAYRLSSVGIGTDTPEEMLDVNGNARVLGNLTAGSASWAQVGNGLTVSNATGVDLARLTATTIAYVDGTNDVLRTYSFDGTDWTQVGNSGSVGAIGAPRMGALTATTVALADIGLDTLRTYSFDGTDWTQVGNSLSLGSVTVGLALAGLNTTDIAYVDGNNDQLRTYRFDGTDWTQVGNSFALGAIGAPAIVALSSTTVAFSDATSDTIRTYRFDGTDWTQVGESYVVAGNPTATAIAALNPTDIAYMDGGLDVLQTYRFDGQEWNPYGEEYSIAGSGSLGVTALNSTDIVYIDISLDTLTTFRQTNTISFVSADQKVGIGVVAPARMLDVRGVAGVDLFDFASSTGDSMLRLTSAGYLGIGTSSPSYALSVAGDVDITGALRFNANPGTLGQILMSQGTSTPTWVATSSLGITAAAVLTGGTEGYLARWISGTTLGTSTLLDDGTYSGVNATSSSYTFNVGGIAGTNPFNVASSTGSSMFTVLANGKVGIGTSSPAYELTVRGGAWITDKLRIGTTTASPIVIGDISGNARGTNAIDLQSTRSVSTQVAASARSVAIGSSNTITGTKGVVIGSDSSAGASGVAIGDSVVAIDSSVAIGVGNDASSASYAIAIGNNSDVIYSYSTAIGSNNYVNQMESLALGNGNTLNYSYNTTNSISDKAALVGFNNTLGVNADQSGSYVSILGSDNQTYGSYNVAVGNSNTIANDNYSSRVAIGFSNIVYGDSSTVVGNANTSALGAGYNSVFGSGNVINTSVYTTLVGYGNYVSSNTAAVMGYGNSATGAEAAAFGRNNNVSGQTSTAVGYANTASGRYSTAVGFDSDATGTSSSAFGWKARATASGTTAIGFNLTNAIANSLMIGPSQSAAATILSTGEFKAPFFTATSTSAVSTFASSVGIGTTTASHRLVIDNTSSPHGIVGALIKSGQKIDGIGTSVILEGISGTGGAGLLMRMDSDSSKYIHLGNEGGNEFSIGIDDGSTFANVLRIKENGDFGISTTTPSARLAVTGGASGDLFALANNSGVEALRVSSSGKLSVSNTAAPSYSPAEFYVDTDPNNPATQALFITAPGNGNRIFFGTSTKTSYALNLTNVSVVENMPYFLTPDAMGWGATNYSHDIGRSGNNVVYQSSGPGGGDHIWYGSSTAYTNYTTSPERARLTGDGRFGIGTSSPAYELTVRGGAWITDKLRIGTTTASPIVIGDISGNTRGTNAVDIQTDRTNVAHVASGLNSVAIGSANVASNLYSVAVGYRNDSTADYAVSIGSFSLAAGEFAVAIGAQANAYKNSVALGAASASDDGIAIGSMSFAAAASSTAIGIGNAVFQFSSLALGNSNILYDTANTLIGVPDKTSVVGFSNNVFVDSNTAASYVSVLGSDNETYGSYGVAIGRQNQLADDTYAHRIALGFSNNVAGEGSIAIGTSNTMSIGSDSVSIIGNDNYSDGVHILIAGYSNIVDANMTVALGTANTIYGSSSIAVGIGNIAFSENSSAFGNRALAVASGSTAIGFNLANLIADSLMIGPSQSAAATILSTGEFKAPFFNATSTSNTSMFAGKVAIGTSTAEAKLDILTGSNDVIGLRIATTTGAAPLFYVSATSTGGLDYARVAVGTTTTFGNVGGPLLDQFTVAGRIYSTWRYASCDLAGISIIATIVANTASVCGPFAFVEDTDGGFEVSSAGNPNFLRLRASTAASIARGEGASLRSFADFVQINNNPSLETWARPQGSNEGWYKIGFFLAAHDTGAHSSDGVYFSLNSTSTNWHAVVRTGANVTEVDTGIAHSTTDFSKFRIDTSLSAVQFYIDGALVANIATNIPSGVNLSTGVSVGIPTVSGSTAAVRNFDIQLLRIWVDDPPGGIAPTEDEGVEAMSEPIPLTFEDFVGERLSQTIADRIETVKEDMLQQALSGFENFADSVVHRIYALTIHAKTLYATAIAVLPDGEILVPAGPSQIAGSSMIPSGSDYVDVVHEGILLTSKIFVTPLDSVSVPLVIEKTEGVGFRVRLSQTQNRDIRFDWLVIQTYGVGGSIESVPGETRFEGDEIEVIEPVPTDDSDGVSSDGSGDSSATPPPDDTSEPDAPTAPESTGDSAGEPAGDTTSEPSSGSTGGSSGDSGGDEGGSAAPSSSGDSGGGGAGGTTSSGGDTGGSSSTSSGGDSGGPSASSSGGDSGGSSSSGGDSGGSSSGGDSGGGSSGGDSGGSSSGGSTGGGAGE